ncbi:MAG TPA: phosphatase PAP2 family protein [Steroidobacteraceae bacterium]
MRTGSVASLSAAPALGAAVTSLTVLLLTVAAAIQAPIARAGGGPLGIDSRVAYDNSGIWARSNQNALIDSMMAVAGLGALWEGGENRLGKTFWQSVDAGVFSGVAEIGLKYVFSRERPSQTSDPNRWFTGHGQSFPSGEVTITSSLVTPFVLEYGRDHPAAYLLELLPIYDGIARVKTWGHWQTDVIAGFALGTAAGYFLHRPGTPIVLSVLPHGFEIGFRKEF